MSITDELRKWAEDNTLRDRELTTCPPQHVVRGVLETLLRIADRIDAEHKRLMRERRRSCVFYDAERNYCKVHDEGDMAELGYVRLPVDADGVPIRVGDVMEGEKIGGGFGEPFEIVGYIMSNGELEPMDEHKCPRKRKYLRHYHEPTVEDVLLELLDEAEHFHSLEEEREAIAEYAAKLRLAGSDAE